MEHEENVVPRPDPTALTTQQLQRELGSLRDIMNAKLDGLRSVIDTRLSGMDKNVSLFREESCCVRTHLDNTVLRLRELHDEKFRSVSNQFSERDVRMEQMSRDAKTAVDAALQAAKEAVGEQNKSNAQAIAKSEVAFTKQIDQLGLLLANVSKTSDDKIDDARSRIQNIEGNRRGSSEQSAVVIGVVGAVVGIGGFVLALIIGFSKMQLLH